MSTDANTIGIARAAKAALDQRTTISRIGKSMSREADQDIIAMREASRSLGALIRRCQEPSAAQANAAARAIIEHDEDRHTCYDHPEDFCCPCGEHAMSRSEWQRHQARAALRAAEVAL